MLPTIADHVPEARDAKRLDISGLDCTANALNDTLPVRLPFPVMWVEYEETPEGVQDGNARSAVLLQQATPSSPIYVRSWCMSVEGRHVSEQWSATIHTDRGGLFQACVIDEDGEQNSAIDAMAERHRVPRREIVGTIVAEFFVAPLLGIALMNCKNVRVEEAATPTKPASKKQKRARLPRLSFSTIIVPGLPQSGGTSTGGGDERAWHMVRGHFATYTADAPAFGRTVGTFWKPAAVRGSKKHGIVTTDYATA